MSAQNVSLAHLLYEARIHTRDLGGKAYCVCDPGQPFRYGDLYRLLNILAHQTTPVNFPPTPALPLLLLSYLVEAYISIQRRYLPSLLPPLVGDLLVLQPALFNYSTVQIIYDDSLARKELGYNPGADTLEGLCLHVREWNENVEAKLKAGKAQPKVRSGVQDINSVDDALPIPPQGVVR